MTTAPSITTERLVLRQHVLADFEPYAALVGSARAEHMGILKRRHAWYSFASDVACWALLGHGAWAIQDRDDGTFLGQIAILKPDQFPEPELGWMLVTSAEGQGIAYEAALEARCFAKEKLHLNSLVSYIAPENTRSIKLAERLDAQLDPSAPVDDPDDLVYRHWGAT